MATVLHIEEDDDVAALVAQTLSESGHQTIGTDRIPLALQALAQQPIDLIISEYQVQGLTGAEVLDLLRRQGHEVPLIVLTEDGDIDQAVASIKAGAVDYLTKPLQPSRLRVAVDQALEYVRLRRKNEALRSDTPPSAMPVRLTTRSRAMSAVLSQVEKVASTRVTVLLQGESGTGKEVLAREIHFRSDRRDKPFVKLNCAALPDGLIESALFGHERGAFTGAIKRVEGAFERAHGGTLLLDEVSEMKLELQAKLLRVLQEREFERIGGSAPMRVDVRVIATTNRNLMEEVSHGRFREDLFYRLSVFPVQLAPLRERLQDLEDLCLIFGARMAAELGKPFSGLTPAALARLREHAWPGNVRELQHALERAVILSTSAMLEPEAFELGGGCHAPRAAPAVSTASGSTLATVHRFPAPSGSMEELEGIVLHTLNVEEAEFALIRRALELTNDNRTKAAEHLGMSVRTLRNKLNARQVRSGDGSAAWQEQPHEDGNFFRNRRLLQAVNES